MSNAQSIEQVDHVFSRNITRSALGIRAATQASHGAIDNGYTHLQRGIYIRQRLPIGVVKMNGQLVCWNRLQHCAQHSLCTGWRTDSDGIAQ